MADPPPWHVTWKPSYVGSDCLAGRLPSRGNVTFAVICPRIGGNDYSVRVVPRSVDGPNMWAVAHSIAWAQRMVERWAMCHWQTVRPPRR